MMLWDILMQKCRTFQMFHKHRTVYDLMLIALQMGNHVQWNLNKDTEGVMFLINRGVQECFLGLGIC